MHPVWLLIIILKSETAPLFGDLKEDVYCGQCSLQIIRAYLSLLIRVKIRRGDFILAEEIIKLCSVFAV